MTLRPDETNRPPEETPVESPIGEETQAAPKEELPKEESKPEPKKEKKRPNPSRSVTTYMLVLFLAAFLLLLISFGMQQRNHQALLDLNDSMEATQDLATVRLEKQQLEYELADLQEDYDKLQADQETLTKEKEDLENQVKAVEMLRRIEDACRSSYDEAKELAEEFEASGLNESLPTEPLVDGASSPAEDYQTIHDMLFN